MRISLFWRTFTLLVGLVLVNVALLLAVMQWLDRAPPEQRLAWEIASIANLTRSALISAQPERRLMLLQELARNEGVQVLPLESADRIETGRRSERLGALRTHLRKLLGAGTMVVLGTVNDVDGLWVSFDIEGDGYWLLMQRNRLERHFGSGLSVVLAISAGLSLLGALVLSRLVNQPLARLASAFGALSRGEPAPQLREDLRVSEIAEVNRRFNEMAVDLSTLDADRSLALAGISHDIRSPLARLRMEAELAPLDDEQRSAIVEDIERIDRIVGQFVEFARTDGDARVEAIDIGQLLEQLAGAYRQKSDGGLLDLRIDGTAELRWFGDPIDLQRIIGNLLDNARRYGRAENERCAHVTARVRRLAGGIELSVQDEGPGVPPDQLTTLVRPFSRLDPARGEREGAGLGLAIVNRLARRYGGQLELRNRPEGGLEVLVQLPDADSRHARARDSGPAGANPARGAIDHGTA